MLKIPGKREGFPIKYVLSDAFNNWYRLAQISKWIRQEGKKKLNWLIEAHLQIVGANNKTNIENCTLNQITNNYVVISLN